MENINNRYNNTRVNNFNSDVDKTLELIMGGQKQTINKPAENLKALNDNELKFPWQI